MNRINLYNLDIGEKPIVRKFNVGPFSISLKKDYQQLRCELKKHKNIETAEVIFNTHESSILCSSYVESPQDAIWDLYYILSYLTGRVVVTPKYSYRFITQYAGGNSIVDEHDFVEALNIAWRNRSNFINDTEKRPLWLYFDYIQTPIIENKLIFATIALEIIQEIVLKDIKIDDGVDSEILKLFCLKRKLKKIIKKSNISDKLKNSLLSNIGNWSSKKSVEGIKRYLFERNFLHDINVYGEVRDRIHFINRLRNSILHRSEVAPPKKNIDMEQIYKFSSVFLPALMQDYLNSKFNIQHFHKVRQTHEYMKGFLYTGKCYGIQLEIPT